MASFSGSSPRPTELPENPGLATFFQQERAETGPAPTPASAPAPAAPQGGSLNGFFRQDANPNRSGKPGGSNITPARHATPISTAAMDAIGQQEGLSLTQRRVMGALLGQESGNGQNAATSIDGARGAGQIMPDTFRHYAKPGEVIDNPAHNLAVMARIVKALGAQAGDDPAKMAVGYFSGSGNINPGSGSAWRNDRLIVDIEMARNLRHFVRSTLIRSRHCFVSIRILLRVFCQTQRHTALVCQGQFT